MCINQNLKIGLCTPGPTHTSISPISLAVLVNSPKLYKNCAYFIIKAAELNDICTENVESYFLHYFPIYNKCGLVQLCINQKGSSTLIYAQLDHCLFEAARLETRGTRKWGYFYEYIMWMACVVVVHKCVHL